MTNTLDIAICDDEEITCCEVEKLINSISDEINRTIRLSIYYTGEGLIEKLRDGVHYDFLILDIELYELNGVSVGKYLRETLHDFYTQIVFISSKQTYAMQLFSVQPLDFLTKPIKRDELKKTIIRGLEMRVGSEDILRCRVGKGIVNIPCRNILYLTSEKRIIRVVCSKEDVSFYGKLSDISKELPNHFQQTHNSFIVNLNAVKAYYPNSIMMVNGDLVSISRKYSKEVKNRLFM